MYYYRYKHYIKHNRDIYRGIRDKFAFMMIPYIETADQKVYFKFSNLLNRSTLGINLIVISNDLKEVLTYINFRRKKHDVF